MHGIDKLELTLKTFGISLSESKIQSLAERKAIPKAPGNQPEVYGAEVCAAGYLTERCGWSENQLMVARHHMGQCFESNASPISKLDSFWSGGIEGKEEQYLDSLNWFFTVVKFLHELPPNGGVEVLAAQFPGKVFEYHTEPAREDRISEGNRAFHPRQIEQPRGSYVGQ